MQKTPAYPENTIGRQPIHRRPAGTPLLLRENGLELRLAARLEYSLSPGLDQDAYEGHCDHLLVIDTARDCLVGTYRLLSFDRIPSFGFYSETEFDLANVKRAGLRLVELGPSCVGLEYRDGKAIRLLFRGIAEYLRRCGADALMGCASIHGDDAEELSAIREMLSRRFPACPELRVLPRRGFDVPAYSAAARIDDASAFRRLPPLFKEYLRLGAKVCGPPAYDRPFGTTDFFVLARTRNIIRRYSRRLFE